MKKLAALAILACAMGCAFVPKNYVRLDEARGALVQARADPQVVRFARAELARAAELFDRATAARDTLDDSAVVDHLAYLAKQRAVISMQIASSRAAAERAPTPPYIAQR